MSSALTKLEISQYLFDHVGFNKKEAKELIELFFGTIREELKEGYIVKLAGFGTFKVNKKRGRPGRNPKTGEPHPVPPMQVVTFRPTPKLYEYLFDSRS